VSPLPPGGVDLCYTARPSLAGASPDQLVARAGRGGLTVLGITDERRVDRIPAVASRALGAGLWPVPGVCLRDGNEQIFAWGFDYQDRELLRLLERPAPAIGATIDRIIRTGGLVWRAGGAHAGVPAGAAGADLPTTTDRLDGFLARAPSHSLLGQWFDRLAWRVRNLPPGDLEASFWPEEIAIDTARHRYLVDLPPAAAPPVPHPRAFVLVAPSGLHALDRIRGLARARSPVRDERQVTPFPELAWRLYALDRREPVERLRSTLRFELDGVRHGTSAGYLFVLEAAAVDLCGLKREIRAALGPRVWRARAGELVDTCVSSFVHLPTPDCLAREYAWLRAFDLVDD
jgi:hypothetical protein